MDSSTLYFVLSLSGFVIVLMVAIVGFFLKRIVSDIKANTEDIGRLKGRVGLAESQQMNDIKRIEENTQLELKVMSQNVGELSNSVNKFVDILIKKGLEKLK